MKNAGQGKSGDLNQRDAPLGFLYTGFTVIGRFKQKTPLCKSVGKDAETKLYPYTPHDQRVRRALLFRQQCIIPYDRLVCNLQRTLHAHNDAFPMKISNPNLWTVYTRATPKTATNARADKPSSQAELNKLKLASTACLAHKYFKRKWKIYTWLLPAGKGHIIAEHAARFEEARWECTDQNDVQRQLEGCWCACAWTTALCCPNCSECGDLNLLPGSPKSHFVSDWSKSFKTFFTMAHDTWSLDNFSTWARSMVAWSWS